jgi:hypothetical protein
MVLLTAFHRDTLSGEVVRVLMRVLMMMFMSAMFFHACSKEKTIAFEDCG